MRIWPFWRYVYFNRHERMGLILLLVIIFALLISRGPVADYLRAKEAERMKAVTLAKWETLEAQLATADSVRKAERMAEFRSKERTAELARKKFEQANFTGPIDINRAGAEEWKSIKGIGEVLSARIIKYRNALGGFYSVEQLKEVYGISDSLFTAIQPRLKMSSSSLKTMDVNRADTLILMQHPYISKSLARQMVRYREKAGAYEKPEDLLKLYSMNDSLFRKLRPYISTDRITDDEAIQSNP